MEQTRLEIIDLRFAVEAVLRKAECRAVHQDVLPFLCRAIKELNDAEDFLTEEIGD